MTLAVIDYGMGNLGSLMRTLEVVAAAAKVVKDPAEMADATGIVLPGVGAFSEGMAQLQQSGWVSVLRAFAARGCPMLGICLGMQLLADEGTEGGRSAGLGIIPGKVLRMVTKEPSERLPHVGWNEVRQRHASPLFEAIPNGADFYFVHSYHFVPQSDEAILAYTSYCGEFAAVIGQGNVWGVQFHPEKSSQFGRQLLKNFVAHLC